MSNKQKQTPGPDTEEFKDRKKALEAELKDIETKLGSSVESFRNNVEGRLDKLKPAYWVNKYPGYSISAAMFLGFILAPSSSRKKRKAEIKSAKQIRSDEYEGSSTQTSPLSVPELVGNEIKRMITRKATSFIVDRLEDWVDTQLKSKDKPAEDKAS
jgi:hypothetical protein